LISFSVSIFSGFLGFDLVSFLSFVLVLSSVLVFSSFSFSSSELASNHNHAHKVVQAKAIVIFFQKVSNAQDILSNIQENLSKILSIHNLAIIHSLTSSTLFSTFFSILFLVSLAFDLAFSIKSSFSAFKTAVLKASNLFSKFNVVFHIFSSNSDNLYSGLFLIFSYFSFSFSSLFIFFSTSFFSFVVKYFSRLLSIFYFLNIIYYILSY